MSVVGSRALTSPIKHAFSSLSPFFSSVLFRVSTVSILTLKSNQRCDLHYFMLNPIEDAKQDRKLSYLISSHFLHDFRIRSL
ncbi:hypothetical protein L6452_37481 [Arctium lappa]|uniref:Uncharacterized protein n=1 Tax=Arctium lappa TaxID=4217 RepID=A0ACB8Y3S1_ARCLA|nr:hypothetical protein L6452_37481 [Arctium lappa]